MGSIAAWLVSIAGPIVTRILLQLGIGIVSYAGVVAAFNLLISKSQGIYFTLPSDILKIFAMGGINDGLGIIVGAILARLSLQVMKRFQLK